MKKLVAAVLTGVLVAGTLSTGVYAKDDDKTITVAASATPHAEILEEAKPLLEKEGYDLEVTVFDIIVGEISYQTACKRRHLFHYRSFIFPDDFSESITGMCDLPYGFLCFSLSIGCPDLQCSVCTGNLHGRFIPQERIPAPHFCLAGTFQQVTMTAGFSQNAHYLYRCISVCIKFSAQRNTTIFFCLCKPPDGF